MTSAPVNERYDNAPTAAEFDARDNPFDDRAYPRSGESHEVLLGTQLHAFNTAFAAGDLAAAWSVGYDLLGLSTPEKLHYDAKHRLPLDEENVFLELDASDMFYQGGQVTDPIEVYRQLPTEPTVDNLKLRQMYMRDALQVLGRGAYHDGIERHGDLEAEGVWHQQGYFILGRDMDVVAFPELSLDQSSNDRWSQYMHQHLVGNGFQMNFDGNAPLIDFMLQIQDIPEAQTAIAMLSGVGYEPVIQQDSTKDAPTETIPTADIDHAAARNIRDDTLEFVPVSGNRDREEKSPHLVGTDLAELLARTPDQWFAQFTSTGEHAAIPDLEPVVLPDPRLARRAREAALTQHYAKADNNGGIDTIDRSGTVMAGRGAAVRNAAPQLDRAAIARIQASVSAEHAKTNDQV